MKKVMMMIVFCGIINTMSAQLDNKPFTVCCGDTAFADIYIVLINDIAHKPIVDQFKKIGGSIQQSAVTPKDVTKFCKSKEYQSLRYDGNAYFLVIHNSGKELSIMEVNRKENDPTVDLKILDKDAVFPGDIGFVNIIIPRTKILEIKKKWR